MPIILDIKPELDDKAANAAASKAEAVFTRAGKGIGQSFGKQFSGGLGGAESDVRKLAREYQKMFDKASDSAGKLLTEEAKLKEMQDKGISGSRLIAQVERTNTARRNEARQVRETADAYRNLHQQQQSSGSAGSSWGKDFSSKFTGGFSEAFKGGAVAGVVIGAFSKISGAVTGLFSSAGHAAASAFQEALKTGIDLQRVENEFKGVSQATTAQMQQMRAKAKELGSDVTMPGVSTAQAAKAMTQLVKDGFSVQEAIGGVRGVLELATAGQIDAAEAAETLGDAINLFQLHASDATRVADIFAATVNASSVSMNDMKLAMSMGGSMSHGFGMSIEQTAAAIGALGKMGIKGSDAGTLMKTMLKQLVNPSKEVTGAMNELGITVADNKGNFVGFESILGQLSRAAKSMSQIQFDELASTAFGSDAIRGAIFAAKGGADVYRDMLGSVTKLGAAHEMAAAQMQGWPGVIEGVKNSIEGIQLSVFDAFNSIAKGYGSSITSSMDKVGDWFSTHQPEIIQAFTLMGITALEVGRSFMIAGQVIMGALGPVVKFVIGATEMISSAMAALFRGLANVAKLPGIRSLLPAGTADQLRQAADESDKLGHRVGELGKTWDQTQASLGSAANTMQGWANGLASAGNQARFAAEMTRALGKSHAEMRGMDIVIKDNTPEVEQRLKALGMRVEKLPNGEVKVVADTAAGQQMIDAWRRNVTGTPINMPIRPVITDADEFRAKIFSWMQAVREGKDPGALPSYNPDQGPAMAGGNGARSWFNLPKGAAPAPAALPPWAAPIPPKAPKNGGGGGGDGGTTGSGYDGGHGAAGSAEALIAFAQRSNGGKYAAASDLVGGLADCSGAVSDLVEFLTKGKSTPARLFSTANEEQVLMSLGAVRGLVPGALQIGMNSGHTAATLPNGVNFESGGSGGGVVYGGSVGAGDKQFTKTFSLPTDMSTGRGATPVSVQNFGSQAQQSLGQIGTSLASDMGLSEGIPGLVKFLVGSLFNMAFAPAMGALSAVQQASGYSAAGGKDALGGGLLGMAFGPASGGGAGGGGGVSGGSGGLGGILSAGMGLPGATGGSGGASDIHSIGGLPGAGGGPGAGLAGPGGQPLPGALGATPSGMGQAFGPSGLTTPKAVGRQIGSDAPQGGGIGFGGGLIGAAAGAAASGGNMMMPGAGAAAGAAAQIGMELMNRTAGFASQVAGIGAMGVLETLSLSDTALADPTNSLLGRVAVGIAGARPQIPNMAGSGGGKVADGTQSGAQGDPNAPPDPNAPQGDKPWVNIENFHNTSGNPSDGKQVGNDMAWRQQQGAMGAVRA